MDVSQDTDEMSFDYDRLGRLGESTDQNGYTVGYEYDDMGRQTKLTYPDASFITYEYDDVGRLETIKDENGYKIVEYTYDQLSRTVQVDYYRGGSFVGSMQYDYEDKVPAEDDNLGSRIARIDYCCNPSHSISYTYDNVGNVTSVDVGGNFGWTYGYDNTYQVTYADQGSATNRAVDFSYDRVYNRTYWTDTLGSIDISYTDNALNQYTDVDGTTPTYDSRGNLTYLGQGQMWCIVFDCENRMTSAINGHRQYRYDLLGRRNRRTIRYPGTNISRVYVWDGAQIIAEYINGSLIKKYIYGPGIDTPVAMINVDMQTQAQTWYYYYADALGSIRLMTDASGTPVESYTYDPYGMPYVMTSAGADNNWLTEDVATQGSSSIYNPYLFTGRRWDSTTGLYYYRFRDYSPALGRFLQTDPAGYIDTMNLYAYCANNPVNWIDPWGLVVFGIGGSGTGGAGGGGTVGAQLIVGSGGVGVYIHGGGGGYFGAGGSGTIDISVFSGNISGLNGAAGTVGAGWSEGFAVGGEFNVGENNRGGTVQIGVGAGPCPIDMYGFGEGGAVVPLNEVIPTPKEVGDYWKDVAKNAKDAAKSAWDTITGLFDGDEDDETKSSN